MSWVTRREWLGALGAAAVFRGFADDRTGRITRAIREFSDQGIHRTGTPVDDRSAAWLAREVEGMGLAPSRESFALSRVDPLDVFVEVGARRIAGIPLFDGTFTAANGVSGLMGVAGSNTEIALLDLTPNSADAGVVGSARRSTAHKAIVCVTRGGRPGLCPSNADRFTAPFGPPVVQVSSEEGAWLLERAREGARATVVAVVNRTPATADNVTATIAGRDRALPPLVVMTPRSGWYTCASERGGGIACWLELMRALSQTKPARNVMFVASSGHELGHLGINAFVEKRPGIVSNAAGWIHFGANIGAATDPGNTVQSSDDESEARLTRAMGVSGLTVDRRVPRGTVPGGEAEVVHRGGGRYVSVIGRNGLFHNPLDRGAAIVNAPVVARFIDAFIAVANSF